MGAQKKTTHKKIHTRLEHHNNKKLWCNFSVATKSLNTAAPSRQLGVTFLGFFSAKSRFGSFKFVGWVGKPQLQRLLLSREPGIPPWSFFVFWGKKRGIMIINHRCFFWGGCCWVLLSVGDSFMFLLVFKQKVSDSFAPFFVDLIRIQMQREVLVRFDEVTSSNEAMLRTSFKASKQIAHVIRVLVAADLPQEARCQFETATSRWRKAKGYASLWPGTINTCCLRSLVDSDTLKGFYTLPLRYSLERVDYYL